MLLETERLVIRNFVPGDLHNLQAILGDAEAMRYVEPAFSLEKTRTFLSEFCIGQRGAVAAIHKESGQLIGYILCKEFEPDVYEMGWIFHRACWGQGYAYEACRAVMAYAFDVLHARKVFAETIDTQKSVRLMQKLGMRCKEIQRQHTRGNDGELYDLHLYERSADC